METLIPPTKTQPFYPSSPLPRTKRRQSFSDPLTSLRFKLREKPNQGPCLAQRLNHVVAARCGNRGPVAELERDMEAEMNREREDDWIVELLECLEREAIMGDDEGRDPTDYNRRAQIFYKSSQVFTDLKERTAVLSHGQS
ncbi:hypothetical protein NC653_031239 [Populus alba x Populus x berolinensis]|uniref:Uncharacterized protein n=1 Tax=Populus alba x Populus x berolinensis TaxID=444605 RepID=A0AAD6LYB7_9ROSI|nr:hypothetical protein NC653_031239 [Populus alba x Populus x berolinensis]